MTEPDPSVERRIREASERLLSGQPRTVTSDRLSVVELSQEAGVSRARLYREYAHLKDEFLARAEEATADPPPATPREQALLDQVRAHEEEISSLTARLTDVTNGKSQWKEAAEAAFRIINLLEVQMNRTDSFKESRELRLARLERENERLNAQLEEAIAGSGPSASLTVLPSTSGDPNAGS